LMQRVMFCLELKKKPGRLEKGQESSHKYLKGYHVKQGRIVFQVSPKDRRVMIRAIKDSTA
jgi:hypothetical protein